VIPFWIKVSTLLLLIPGVYVCVELFKNIGNGSGYSTLYFAALILIMQNLTMLIFTPLLIRAVGRKKRLIQQSHGGSKQKTHHTFGLSLFGLRTL
jgi:hypothetical protein